MENCHVYIPQDDMHAFSNLKQCCPAVRKSCSSQKSERKSALRFVSVSVTGLVVLVLRTQVVENCYKFIKTTCMYFHFCDV